MWKLTVTALAPPVIVFVAVKTCFKSIKTDESDAIGIVVAIDVPFIAIVNVAAVEAVFVTTMLVTTAVVDAGVV